jgi:hypothetical protein
VEPSEKERGVGKNITAQATATEENLVEGRTKYSYSYNSAILTEYRITYVEKERQISKKKRVVNVYHMGKYTDVVETNMIKLLSDNVTTTNI